MLLVGAVMARLTCPADQASNPTETWRYTSPPVDRLWSSWPAARRGGVVAASAVRRHAAIPTSTRAAGAAAVVVRDRILNADSAFQIFECIFQMAEQALQVRHASPASDEPEIEIVGVVRQGDVDCLPSSAIPSG